MLHIAVIRLVVRWLWGSVCYGRVLSAPYWFASLGCEEGWLLPILDPAEWAQSLWVDPGVAPVL